MSPVKGAAGFTLLRFIISPLAGIGLKKRLVTFCGKAYLSIYKELRLKLFDFTGWLSTKIVDCLRIVIAGISILVV